MHDAGNLYSIIIKGNEDPIPVRREYKDFVERLRKGDIIIVVRHGLSVKLVYGPIDEGRLYVPPKF